MSEAMSNVRADFDRIALLSGEEWGHNGLYHDFLARHVPDLFQAEGLSDAFLNALAVPVSVGLRLYRRGRLLPPREVRRAWDEHGRHDSYLTLAQVREVC